MYLCVFLLLSVLAQLAVVKTAMIRKSRRGKRGLIMSSVGVRVCVCFYLYYVMYMCVESCVYACICIALNVFLRECECERASAGIFSIVLPHPCQVTVVEREEWITIVAEVCWDVGW